MRKINDYVFFAFVLALSTLLAFFAGRFSLRVQMRQSVPPIQTVGEINPKVPVVEVIGYRNGYLFGKTNDRDMRLKLKNQIAIPNKNSEFHLDLKEFIPPPVIPEPLKEQSALPAINAPVWAKFVASVKGKYYYSITDEYAKRLSVKNRRYFATEEEAKKAGYKKRN